MKTKRIKNAYLDMMFHEKFNIKKILEFKKECVQKCYKHKFAVIDSYGNEKTESNIIKTEHEREFQQRLDSTQMTAKYRNIQEITDKIFDTCGMYVKSAE